MQRKSNILEILYINLPNLEERDKNKRKEDTGERGWGRGRNNIERKEI